MVNKKCAHMSKQSEQCSFQVLALFCAYCLARIARGNFSGTAAALKVVRGVARGEEGGECGSIPGRCDGV